VQPLSGLVSWWPGDGNAQDIVGPNDGTLQGGATFAPGMVGEAFKLNGVDQFVELPSTNVLYDPVTGFTWEAWVRPAALGEMVVLGAADGVPCEDLDIRIGGFDETGIPPDHVVARVDPLGACEARQFVSALVPGGIQPGTNHHLALTVDYPNSIARLYLNGQEGGSTVLTGTPIARNMEVSIGVFRDDGFFERQFNGLIDEVSVYNRALSAAEIQAIFNAGSAGKCKETGACTLNLAPSITEGTLTLAFQLGTQEPATWNVWLTAQSDLTRLLSFPLPAIDPPAQVPITTPFFSSLGTIGFLSTLTTPDQGILCSDFATVDTGPIADNSAPTLHELQDLLGRSYGE
jgi:Concanavalin A-like lectin/glucanases superfamily